MFIIFENTLKSIIKMVEKYDKKRKEYDMREGINCEQHE